MFNHCWIISQCFRYRLEQYFLIFNVQCSNCATLVFFHLYNSNYFCKNRNLHIFNLWSSIFQPVLHHHLNAAISRSFKVDENQVVLTKLKNRVNQSISSDLGPCGRYTSKSRPSWNESLGRHFWDSPKVW